MDLSQIVLVVVAAIFLGYLLIQVRPTLSPAGRAALGVARAASQRAREAKDDTARAIALCDAGEANAKARRWLSSVGYFSRALRVAPEVAPVVERMSAALATRPRLLASVLERRMMVAGHNSDRTEFVALAKRLVPLLSGSARRRAHAAWLKRLIELEERAAPPS